MKWIKKNLTTIILVIIMLLGIGLLLYPTVADYWNSIHQSAAISKYVEAVGDINQEEYDRLLKEAAEYNKELRARGFSLNLTESEMEKYLKTLDFAGTGMMGYIEIQRINCVLPIYHGIDDGILQTAIGHIPGTSLPVGGDSTHAVLSGHRGLPSARLFTDLDKLEKGDIFVLRIMNEVLTYEVDQIEIVLPANVSNLEIEEGKDYCTLITCTPYGVNSHRLLVRGHRVENGREADLSQVVAEAVQIDKRLVAPVLAIPILLILIIGVLIKNRRRR